MTRAPKTHYSHGKEPGDIQYVTLCGRMESTVAATPTCEKCLQKLPELKKVVEYVEEVFTPGPETRYGQKVYPEPKREPFFDPATHLPLLSPQSWQAHKSKHWCFGCPICSHFTKLEADAEGQIRKKRHTVFRGSHRWPSVPAALEWYLDQIEDGFVQSSGCGWAARIGKVKPDIAERMDDHIRKCVATVTSARGSAHTPKAIADAGDRVDLGQALAQCYPKPCKYGLSRTERRGILFARTVGPRRRM